MVTCAGMKPKNLISTTFSISLQISLMPIAEPTNGPPSVEDSSAKLIASSLSSSGTSCVTQQDLARMFPTPPSPAYTDLSPIMSIHDTQGTGGTPVTCITLLSSEMTHSVTVSEKDKMEVNVELKPLHHVSYFLLIYYQVIFRNCIFYLFVCIC